ncbi:MAG: hypothetical protein APZ16_04320 [Candidatus Hadarchaeum yellowstonense]|jgi:hypothetical protein|uniref:HhH-GPD domain-containing protein n=1 Tax=Hadarchaeum yellowstonense TaxID=1776334 RepID=A0A147K0Y1_HADYE|nr:MAG: hypothetical protein APZ16_04320 [Candidatus Hadarchaeum yellowstonense]
MVNRLRALSRIPSYSRELGLDLRRPNDRFKWFLVSLLFAKRISANVALRTYRMFEAEGLVTPEAILAAGWDRLVEVLDAAGYVRYDFSTASTLLETMGKIKELGGLERIHQEATDPQDLERRLQELRGVGPVACNIFLRELRGIWSKARPQPSRVAVELGRSLGLSGQEIERFESPLVRIHLEFCKRQGCVSCPVGNNCRNFRSQRSRARG